MYMLLLDTFTGDGSGVATGVVYADASMVSTGLIFAAGFLPSVNGMERGFRSVTDEYG